MIRFILRRNLKDDPFGTGYSRYETIVADVPELEHSMRRGGTNQNGYDVTEFVGVEILDSPIDTRSQS